jgi:N-acetyl-anhydromuramyl-L-alanine amidase AmpD
MPHAKRSLQGTTTIDDFSLIWNLHREQQLSTADGWRGVAIHVKVAEGVRRELHLEYPAVQTQKISYARADHLKQNISPTKVAAHIRLAMEAGYDPGSRGKPFVYEVDELPG